MHCSLALHVLGVPQYCLVPCHLQAHSQLKASLYDVEALAQVARGMHAEDKVGPCCHLSPLPSSLGWNGPWWPFTARDGM